MPHENMPPAAPLSLRIEGLVPGGQGIARHEGLVVFVPAAAPGDLVEVDIVRRAPDYAVGRIRRVIEPGAGRRVAPCPLFPACGGCQWQHLAYPDQLAAKQDILRDAFHRVGGFEKVEPGPVTPSIREFGYRHRMQVKISTAGKRLRWGFFAATSHTLVELRRCLIAHPSINALLAEMDRLLAQLDINPGLLGTFDLNTDGSGGRVELVLHPRRRSFNLPGHGRILEWKALDGTALEIMVINASRLRTLPVRSDWFTFPSHEVVLSAGAGAFTQANLAMNPALVAAVVESAQAGPADTVLDIYCGVGNYTLPLARRAKTVMAIENNPRSCLFGESNARAHGLTNIRFIKQNADDVMAALDIPVRTAILNPPRVGAADTVRALARLKPERVVYVSCGPPTLARDAAILAAAGYRLERLTPFDMFPQTHHLETVALLIRS